MIYETAPAKINLTLDTLFKRDDGFHEVEMIMTTIDLNDRLSFELRQDNKIVVDVEQTYVPSNSKNLAYKAAELMKKTYNLQQGITITIDKNIPVSAGLAGGSTDAAATMRGMNRLYKLNRPLEELCELGISIGTDIPFCIYGKTALCKGKGEKINFLNKPPSAWVVVAKPNIGISSPDIFKKLDLSHLQTINTEDCKTALNTGNYELLCSSLSNQLEPVSSKVCPEILKIKRNMLKSGADGAVMSGSGPTVYGLTQKERQARHVYNAVNGCCNEVYLVRLLG
ncbi:4-(cytidine 5'-diphospho)-2-C-methyl-D-erythritol kinase [Staphylococcus gallinarum]|jgi:4-diphosphocytidyl-2-C-methyl-D-erythritol kinase|uniref:Putative 4-diphosphocytidyl-2-C-methyl-D-erythritol kinase n=1 Tax=Staphylococcus gallinarum TaxID=1293 RepID=A0A0D0SN72_STAGA|nr:4-(cytidine 5'-diphospho)-2-C-methyl-D-erythritol kinase [Staphylococcus gallinarum]KIR10539.1 4-diphosphocytidyl-2C-methyl-D-erythritol kinase [Staphylococcus gallinarum]MCD8822359.1 4-(cytidine 5'-diphospho)-2-C-methyl-D-erythritol kinase [Staphylococcus gallinarum]MCD8827725.1 4-(cytidine 5'-diphospho)-2-C-methyl-D-erythritol kinase [Staphylococcus gallinarum]MCD8845347.1 4-(cytidine 5'-diphospho)-2-C-methyl-D-erythritol kinase [Staphylococcus gallinarum]MCD8872621.1 4-(cytidine 5'-dipho